MEENKKEEEFLGLFYALSSNCIFSTLDPVSGYKVTCLNNLQITNNSSDQGVLEVSTTLQQLAYGAINLTIAKYVTLIVNRLQISC